MADENIVISVKDEVASTPADKFREFAVEAIAAQTAIDALKKSLTSLPTTSVGKIAASLDRIANATSKVAVAEAKANAEAAKQAITQQRLATELAKTEAAEARAAITKERLSAVSQKQQKANAAVTETLQQQESRLLAIARAGVAEAQAQRDQVTAAMAAANARQTETVAIVQQTKFTQAQIKAAQDATRAARDRLNATAKAKTTDDAAIKTINEMSVALDGMTKKAKLSRNQVMTLQYTASDIVASLGSGISPMTIALQQGPQVAQAFTKELGALASRFGIVIGAATAFATAIATLGILYNKAAGENAAFNNSLTITGNYAALNSDAFLAMANDIADSSNKSISSVKEVANVFVSSGQFQRDQIAQNTESVLRFSKFTGQAADEVAKNFLQMADSPASFAEAMNKQYHFLSAAQLTQIRQLEEVGNKTAATELVSRRLYDYLAEQDSASMSPLAEAWSFVSRNISNATNNLAQFIYELKNGVGPRKELAEINKQLQDMTNANSIASSGAQFQKERKDLIARGDALQEQIAAEDEANQKKSDAIKLQGEIYESSKRISNQWLKTVDNVGTANRQIEAFRADLAKGLQADKGSDDYKEALRAQAKQAEIEKKIREANMPETKASDKVGETRALALAKINGELDKQVNGLGVLRPQRELQQKLDQYEIDLASRKIKLSAEERSSIEQKLKTIQDYNEAQQQTDRIYEESTGPLRNYNAVITAANALLKSGTISQEEHTQQVSKAYNEYANAVDPLREYNMQLDQQDKLLSMGQPQREVSQQLMQVENTLRAQGLSLYSAETGALNANGQALQKRLETQQEATRVQQAYDAIYATTAGQQQQLAANVKATTLAYQQGLISMDVYGAKIGQLGLQAAQLRIQSGNILPGDMELASFGKIIEGYQGLLSGLADSFGTLFVDITDGFANAIAGAIVGTESLGDALRSVAQQAVQQLIASLIKVGIQYAVNAALGQSLGASAVAGSIAQAGTVATAWAPAAAAVSLASFGSNGIPAAAAIASANTLSMGFAMAGFEQGGWTGGGGRKQVAGVVHGQEYVMPADATARIGVANLDAMKDGRMNAVTAGSGAADSVGNWGGSGSPSVNIQIINNANNSEVTTSKEQGENGELNYTVTIDSIEKTLASRVESGRGPLHAANKKAFGLTPKPQGG